MHESFRTYANKVNYKEGEGLPPDLMVKENIEDLISGKDAALEAALRRIEQGF